jgi:hypothetical protein
MADRRVAGESKQMSRLADHLGEDQQVILRWEGLEPITFTVKEFLP